MTIRGEKRSDRQTDGKVWKQASKSVISKSHSCRLLHAVVACQVLVVCHSLSCQASAKEKHVVGSWFVVTCCCEVAKCIFVQAMIDLKETED